MATGTLVWSASVLTMGTKISGLACFVIWACPGLKETDGPHIYGLYSSFGKQDLLRRKLILHTNGPLGLHLNSFSFKHKKQTVDTSPKVTYSTKWWRVP